MSQAYTPGLLIQEQVLIHKLRELPLSGRALVRVGDRVTADTIVLQADLPGEIEVVALADRLGLEPEEVAKQLTLRAGDRVAQNQLLLEARYFFGLFRSQIYAPVEGTVEFFTSSNGHLGLRQAAQPLTLQAYVPGVISRVEESRAVEIECAGALIQGAFGVGGERSGVIVVPDFAADMVITEAAVNNLAELPADAVLIGGARFTADALFAAARRGVKGVITGSIDSKDLRAFIGYEVGVSMTGDEQIPLSLIVTEGFGHLSISPRILEIAKRYDRRACSLSGATQVRAGAIRPELIIPNEGHTNAQALTAPELKIGAKVRCIRSPYFGKFGNIEALPHEPVAVESGAVLRIAMVKLAGNDGPPVPVPRANLELVGE